MSQMRRLVSCSAVSTRVTPLFVSYAVLPVTAPCEPRLGNGPARAIPHQAGQALRSFACTAVSACSEKPAPTSALGRSSART
jgi:hypothetical protein